MHECVFWHSLCFNAFYHLCTKFTTKEIEIRMSSDNLTWWVFFSFCSLVPLRFFCVHTIIFVFFFFPFCFRLECFCTWINSRGKMVGWLEHNNSAKEREERKTTHQTSNGTTSQITHRKQIQRCCSIHTYIFKWIAIEIEEKRIKT